MKIIKYFIQFVIIIFLFFIFKFIGYRNASNLGSKIGKIFGKIIRSDKIIKKNIQIIKKIQIIFLKIKIKLFVKFILTMEGYYLNMFF